MGDSSPHQQDSRLYTFQGVTRDNAYYVSLTVPVRVDVLPEISEPLVYSNEEDEWETEQRYINSIRATLNNAASSAVQPTMESLSQIALTLSMADDSLLNTLDTSECSDTEAQSDVVRACETTQFSPRLIPGSGARQILPEIVVDLPGSTPGGKNVGWSISSGQVVGVMAGPVCVDGRNHWLVYQFERGWSGWIAESAIFYRLARKTPCFSGEM